MLSNLISFITSLSRSIVKGGWSGLPGLSMLCKCQWKKMRISSCTIVKPLSFSC